MVSSSRLLYIIRDVLSCGWYFKWYMQLHISWCNIINMWYFKEDSISKKFSTHRYFCRDVNFIGNESPILELELRSWSWLSFGAILPFLLSVERSSRDIKHLPRHYNVFSQHPPIYTIVSPIWPEDWEGTVFRSNKYFTLCL